LAGISRPEQSVGTQEWWVECRPDHLLKTQFKVAVQVWYKRFESMVCLQECGGASIASAASPREYCPSWPNNSPASWTLRSVTHTSICTGASRGNTQICTHTSGGRTRIYWMCLACTLGLYQAHSHVYHSILGIRGFYGPLRE
jgi:hypothetical protein